MREFVLFGRHFLKLVHFARGVLLVLLVALLVCTVLMALVEGGRWRARSTSP